jgi:hypothetical protein
MLNSLGAATRGAGQCGKPWPVAPSSLTDNCIMGKREIALGEMLNGAQPLGREHNNAVVLRDNDPPGPVWPALLPPWGRAHPIRL